MAEVNFNELFGNFSAADALAATETKKNSSFSVREDLYKPSIKDEKCNDMNYRALIRFIPFFHEGKWRTTLSRWECFLKDVNGENGMFVVSPKTDGKSCPMRNLSYQLYKSENAIDKENSKKINVYQQFYALIEVISDAQHPEYVGKFFIYQFGAKIDEKIEAVMHSTEYEDGINPFALYDAPLFEINLKKDPSKKMENGSPVTSYEACRFTTKTAPIHFGENETLTNDLESQKAFLTWLDTNAPKIKDYLWKEWDAETTEKVNERLATFKTGYSAPRSTAAKAQEAVNIVSESPAPKIESPAPKHETQVETSFEETEETPVSGEDESWINDILNS